MKITKILAAATFSLFLLHANAQKTPKGFQQGTITLADGSSLPGLVKDNMDKNASVTFMATANDKKKNYDAASLTGVEINGAKFTCIKGDFFKVICNGNLCFLQKASDASGKLIYNGTEGSFSSGTEGKPGDYFLYNNSNHELQWVSKKNVEEIIAKSFAGNSEAINKAKTINGDLSLLKDAVEVYNSSNK